MPMEICVYINDILHYQSLLSGKTLNPWRFSYFDWPDGLGRSAENRPIYTCIYFDGQKATFAGVIQFWFIYMHKWYHAISITFIRENSNPAIFLPVFGGPHGPWCGAELGSLYACIYSGGQMGKLIRLKYATFVTPGKFFYNISTRLRPLLKKCYETPAYMRFMSLQCHTCHSREWHIRFMRWIYGSSIIYMCVGIIAAVYRISHSKNRYHSSWYISNVKVFKEIKG